MDQIWYTVQTITSVTLFYTLSYTLTFTCSLHVVLEGLDGWYIKFNPITCWLLFHVKLHVKMSPASNWWITGGSCKSDYLFTCDFHN